MDTNSTSMLGRTTSTLSNSLNSNQRIQIVEPSEVGKLSQTDFLNMLLTQLQNQDPLSPMDNTEFASQLAQYSSLEQLTNISGKIDRITELILAQMVKPGEVTGDNNTTENKVESSTENKAESSTDKEESLSRDNTITFTRDLIYPKNDESISKINSILSNSFKNTYLNI